LCDAVFNAPFDVIDLSIECLSEFIVHDLNISRNTLLTERADLSLEPLAHIDKLSSLRRQGSEKT
jgi:hypothetical protein